MYKTKQQQCKDLVSRLVTLQRNYFSFQITTGYMILNTGVSGHPMSPKYYYKRTSIQAL